MGESCLGETPIFLDLTLKYMLLRATFEHLCQKYGLPSVLLVYVIFLKVVYTYTFNNTNCIIYNITLGVGFSDVLGMDFSIFTLNHDVFELMT